MPGSKANLAIIGNGLMGGSLGIACIERGIARTVKGYDLRADRMERALARGALTEASSSVSAAVEAADVVFIATPVESIVSVFEEMSEALREGAIVTDLGSTKARVVSEIESISRDSRFIGGHPIAGAEEEGIDGARADLYDGCVWILTPTESTDTGAYSELVRLITQLGARVLSLDPTRHDRLVALTSHLPQLISSALMVFAAEIATSEGGIPLVTAGGFRDMTRVAASNPDLWVGILRDNRDAVLEVLAGYEEALAEMRKLLEGGHWDQLRDSLGEAREARRSLPGKPGLAAADLVELLIPVPDRPGVLAEITTTLGEAGLNIEDIDILHSPEGGRGTIHLSVGGEKEARLAEDAIRVKDYRVLRAE